MNTIDEYIKQLKLEITLLGEDSNLGEEYNLHLVEEFKNFKNKFSGVESLEKEFVKTLENPRKMAYSITGNVLHQKQERTQFKILTMRLTRDQNDKTRVLVSNYIEKLDIYLILLFFCISAFVAWIIEVIYLYNKEFDLHISIFQFGADYFVFISYLTSLFTLNIVFLIFYFLFTNMYWRHASYEFLLKRIGVFLYLLFSFNLPFLILVRTLDFGHPQTYFLDMPFLIIYYFMVFPILLIPVFNTSWDVKPINGDNNEYVNSYRMLIIDVKRLVFENELKPDGKYKLIPRYNMYIEKARSIPISHLLYQNLPLFLIFLILRVSTQTGFPAEWILMVTMFSLSFAIIYLYYDININFSSNQIIKFRFISTITVTLIILTFAMSSSVPGFDELVSMSLLFVYIVFYLIIFIIYFRNNR